MVLDHITTIIIIVLHSLSALACSHCCVIIVYDGAAHRIVLTGYRHRHSFDQNLAQVRRSNLLVLVFHSALAFGKCKV